MGFIPQILFVVFLVLINAFFVASEIVLITLRKSNIDELIKKDSALSRMLKTALNNLESYISATQLGVTFTSLALGWLSEAAFAGNIEALFSFIPKGPFSIVIHSLAIALAFLLITFIQIVLGELVPKTIALSKADTIALVIIMPLYAFATVFRPFINILNKSARLVLKLIGFSNDNKGGLVYKEEEIRSVIENARINHTFHDDEIEMLQNVFKLRNTKIKQIMMPRTDIIAFEANTTLEKLMQLIEHYNRYSRFPVYEGSIDNITGFIHVKDVYRMVSKTKGEKKLKETTLMRKIINVPEAKKADEVLLDMRREHVHLAVVNDEYGGTAGIVTLEDIVESLIGDIQDEFDKQIKEIKRQVDGSYIIDGRAPFELLTKRLNLSLKNQGYTTVGGFVFGLLGREPHMGDKVKVDSAKLIIESIKGKRVERVRLVREKMV